jgi:hypothetical protein
LEALGPSDYYNLVGETATPTLAHNHYGTSEVGNGALAIAKTIFKEFGKKISINDMSLPWGGLFDINGDWLTPHTSHRRGMSVDINRCVELDGSEAPDEFDPCTKLGSSEIIPGYGLVDKEYLSKKCEK